MEKEKQLSIIIPVYNGGACIKELVSEISTVLTSNHFDFEIIIVDDGSKDDSWQKIREIKKENNFVNAFSLAKNFGQHKATLCGFCNASGRVIITIDDDFEQRPEDIPVLYNQLINSNTDVVYGVPKNVKKTFTRKLITSFYKFISKVENKNAGVGSSFRAIKKELVVKIIEHPSHLFFIDELLLWYTSNIESCHLDFNVSRKKSSGYGYMMLFSLSLNVLIMSTTMPLKFVRFIGVSMSLISFLVGTFYFLKKLIFKSPAGYTSIIVSILFSAGIILFCLAIIGEYLGNVLQMQNNKPAYYIREKL